ncbi:hypothetical protein [Rosistilla oblonga]|uniref:Phage major tail protein 2 n=1 Tax=Rosistilla oblonga TaxID=2527990 RepID=A0A518ITV2_9BACT|nr:hypothetical protein [Rosistilla oblonga]QDV56515.1 hypothetical protein Mal33_25060 [Rosistilla oblonga]
MATGNGSTVTFATSGFTARFEEIGEVKQTRGKIKDSDLASEDFHEYLPEDLAEPGEREFKIFWEGDNAPPSINSAAELVTVTHKLEAGQATAAKFIGSAFITDLTVDPKHANNETKQGTLKIQYDNKSTAPAFTEAVAS